MNRRRIRILTAAFGLACLAWALPAVLSAHPGASPTPTPRPRLSGGFGRTPVPVSEGDGQSLADVVRAASVARVHKDQKGVAITNESLVKDPKKGRLSTSQVMPATPAPAAPRGGATPAAGARVPASGGPMPEAPPTAAPAPAAASASSPSSADEAMWRERAHRTRQRVEELKAQVTSLDAETKQLENDFYRWDDGQYRDRVIKPSWDKKREELETARRQLVQAEADLTDLPEQARKAGALPGWLRE